MADPAAPKFDVKMLVVPAILFFGKKIDFKDPQVVELTRNCFFGAVVLVLVVYGFIYMRIVTKKDEKNIWVPPKPKPSLPFGLGPAPEPLTVADYEATTYKGYESKLVREGVQSVLLSGTISYFMAMKFGPMSMVIQAVMMPMNLSDNVTFKKYIVGVTGGPDGSGLYNEETAPPTAATVAALNVKYGSTAEATADAVTEGSSAANTTFAAGEPRVVELKDEDSTATSGGDTDGLKKRKGKKEKKATTDANEID